MMSELAIRAVGLGKQYHINHLTYLGRKSFRESVVDLLAMPARRVGRLLRAKTTREDETTEIFWALQDASFEIKRGEIVGIIGRNGAGKSTLLKVLSRITEPSVGRAEIYGRMGSLLEVGTGFHPELTGRENIFLSGAILGMAKADIDRQFDEIVAFSEIERFLDTPVKYYSSGMYVRLGFAVAAHLEPEILVVDEVLAVGDAQFQKKCLAKMEDVRQGGRTVIFVSHNLSAVTRICQRVILLDAGRVAADGPASDVVSSYLTGGLGTMAAREWPDIKTAPGKDIVRLRAARVRVREGQVTDAIDIRESVGIEMEFETLQPGYLILPHFHMWNEEGVCVMGALDLDPTWRRKRRPVGRWVTTGWIPGNFLAEGTAFVDIAIIVTEPVMEQVWEPSLIAFQVVGSTDGDTHRGDWAGHVPGVVRPVLEWTTQYSDPGSRP
jgi:lipopolysaccharide transport system ATP-binding protein